MRIRYIKIPPNIVKHNRTFYKNHVKKAFTMWCAYEGFFDGVLDKAEIKRAKKGVLPPDLNIHHKIPLSGSLDMFVNDFSNLSIIHKNTHQHINRHEYAPQIRPLLDMPYGTEIDIEVTNFPYVDREGIKEERLIAQRLKFRKNWHER